MKKLLFVLISFIIVFPVFGQDIDLTAMSFDELSVLKQQVDLEWRSRPENEIIDLPIGIYTVGTDIPYGDYYAYRKDLKGANPVLYVYPDGGGKELYRIYISGTKPDRINTFHEKYKIVVSDSDIILSPVLLNIDEFYGIQKPEGTEIPIGVYTIGKEIPAGKYVMYTTGSYSSVEIYPSMSIYNDADERIWSVNDISIDDSDNGISMYVNDGNVIEIESNSILMKKDNTVFNFD